MASGCVCTWVAAKSVKAYENLDGDSTKRQNVRFNVVYILCDLKLFNYKLDLRY